MYDMAKLKIVSKSDLLVLVLSIKSKDNIHILHLVLLINWICHITHSWCLCSRLVLVCLFINGEWAKSKLWLIVTETYLRARQTTCRSAGGSYHNQLLLLVKDKVKWMSYSEEIVINEKWASIEHTKRQQKTNWILIYSLFFALLKYAWAWKKRQ